MPWRFRISVYDCYVEHYPVTQTIWTYRFGAHRLMYDVTFEGNHVYAIRSIGYPPARDTTELSTSGRSWTIVRP